LVTTIFSLALTMMSVRDGALDEDFAPRWHAMMRQGVSSGSFPRG
jgi:hypothetical protein